MGKAGSKFRFWTRPLKNYNIEQRAQKEISKEKPTLAPQYHESMEKIMQEIRNDPNLLTRGQPSKETLEKLGKVYLKSTGDNPVIRTAFVPSPYTLTDPNLSSSSSTSTSKLPKSTAEVIDPFYGYEEPNTIPKGRLSLRQALDLISKHQQDKVKWSSEMLSEEFKINLDTTRNILEHFRTFQVYIPTKSTKDKEMGTMEKMKAYIEQPMKDILVPPEKDDPKKKKMLNR